MTLKREVEEALFLQEMRAWLPLGTLVRVQGETAFVRSNKKRWFRDYQWFRVVRAPFDSFAINRSNGEPISFQELWDELK